MKRSSGRGTGDRTKGLPGPGPLSSRPLADNLGPKERWGCRWSSLSFKRPLAMARGCLLSPCRWPFPSLPCEGPSPQSCSVACPACSPSCGQLGTWPLVEETAALLEESRRPALLSWETLPERCPWAVAPHLHRRPRGLTRLWSVPPTCTCRGVSATVTTLDAGRSHTRAECTPNRQPPREWGSLAT